MDAGRILTLGASASNPGSDPAGQPGYFFGKAVPEKPAHAHLAAALVKGYLRRLLPRAKRKLILRPFGLLPDDFGVRYCRRTSDSPEVYLSTYGR